MDLSTGPGLVAGIADTINRQDAATLAVIKTWVRLAEASINRVLRTSNMIKKATSVFDTPFQVLPTGFLEMQSVNLITPQGPKPLQYAANEDLDKLRNVQFLGSDASHFQIEGGLVEIAPFKAGCTVEMRYYEKIPALNLEVTNAPESTNWLLRDAPDAYLYAALIHSGPYLHEDERTEVWTQLASSVVEGLNIASKNASRAGSRINTIPRTFG